MTDLSTCTPQQRQVITTLDRPIMVSAGAGSGKTFTLTQRIACAFEGGSDAVVDDISQICAITYTKRAAAELKSRIKAKLAAEGFADQARRVDDAWICTIHAMAARILRENAIELHLDPTFEVLDETERDALYREAVEAVAQELEAKAGEEVARLLAEEPLLTAGGAEGPLLKDAGSIIARVHAMPEGFEGIDAEAAPRSASSILDEMAKAATAVERALCAQPKLNQTDQKVLDAISAAKDAVAELDEAAREALGGQELLRLMYLFPPTSPKYGAKGDGAELFAEYRSTYARLFEEARATAAQASLRLKVRVAQRIDEAFREIKGPGRLDQDDLLRQCYGALRDEPAIAERYRSLFRLIMVDEFQDTDRLQTAMIGLIAQPGFANVCTVGDAQQSIYRFRGADVSVFEAHAQRLREGPSSAFVELPDNFRSHRDVLGIVDALFGRPGMFGSSFLHLEPRGKVNDALDPLFESMPRIHMDVISYRNRGKGERISVGEVRGEAARRIAEHLSALAEAGAPASDMALLLGRMSDAEVYAAALREVGLSSMVVAGSTFTGSYEAQLTSSLLALARNAGDDRALLDVLLSPLFNLSDDVLLACSSRSGGEGMGRRSLSEGFFLPDDGVIGLLDLRSREALDRARAQVGDFIAAARAHRTAQGLRRLLAACGLLDRLAHEGAPGTAFAGNLEKACGLVARFEAETAGIAELSERFDAHLRLAQERPGLLASQDADFVTIMTVHGSKGLEFPHVVVAEMGMGSSRAHGFAAENLEGSTLVAALAPLDPAMSTANRNMRLFDRLDSMPELDASNTAAERFRILDAHARQQEIGEAKRLLYVGLTRAVKSLMLSVISDSDPEKGYGGQPIMEDLHGVFAWPLDAVSSIEDREVNGIRARVSFLRLPDARTAEEEGGSAPDAADDGAPGTDGFLVCERAEPPRLGRPLPAPSAASDMVSYTSLARSDGPHEAAVTEPPIKASADADKATDLGTAFHRIAQQAIIRAAAAGAREPVAPDRADLDAQVRSCSLTDRQERRLQEAVARWLSSDLAHELFSHRDLHAEAPFTVLVEDEGGSFFLTGEIDALAWDGGSALIVDYKTGGSSEEDEDALFEKHLLQARCYAYAALSAGAHQVRAVFVRVEQPEGDGSHQPQTMEYRFTAADRDSLHHIICEAHRYARDHG